MQGIKATVQGGRLDLEVPRDWPDGTEVEIQPVDRGTPANGEGPLSSDEIARILAAMDQIEPFVLTDDERAAFETDRQARKEWEQAHFNEQADRLQEDWQ